MNIVRKKTDYYWLSLFYIILYGIGYWFFPNYTSVADSNTIYDLINFMGFSSPILTWIMYFVGAALSISTMTYGIWKLIKMLDPNISTTYLEEQLKAIKINMILLSAMQTVFDIGVWCGYTKVTMGNDTVIEIIRDVILWMLMFEITWYTQHRAMHDNKTLWEYGHAYHHGWRSPEHMIGITNFAFDHIVEIWVTMSSANIAQFFFPINFYARLIVSFGYMVLAIFAHWDAFPYKYHLNHHYKVVKNYGSHIPIFDIIFGTYYFG